MKESKFYQEIMLEGSLQTRRADILDALRVRFPTVDVQPFTAALEAIENPDELMRLHRLAIRCTKPEDFRAGLSAHSVV